MKRNFLYGSKEPGIMPRLRCLCGRYNNETQRKCVDCGRPVNPKTQFIEEMTRRLKHVNTHENNEG